MNTEQTNIEQMNTEQTNTEQTNTEQMEMNQTKTLQMTAKSSIILASASPRRRELLQQVGIKPVVEPSHVEEIITSTQPDQVVMELSRQKAEDIAKLHCGEPVVVIGSDTVVAVDGMILGKPGDREDAIHMIERLQGREHQVYTGVTLVFCGDAACAGGITFAERTDVHVYPMSREQIEGYVDTGEPMDKAGAYGIQGRFAAYVQGISGDYNNVVGLPVGRVCQELMKAKAEGSL